MAAAKSAHGAPARCGDWLIPGVSPPESWALPAHLRAHGAHFNGPAPKLHNRRNHCIMYVGRKTVLISTAIVFDRAAFIEHNRIVLK
jgi:hypothetical protein